MTTQPTSQPTPEQASPQRPRRRTDLKVLAVLTLSLAAFILGFAVRGSDARNGEHVSAAPTAETQVQIYTCSMHPEIRNPGPGKCPICGMDLVPVAEEADDADAGPRTLSLSSRAAALLNIQTTPAQRRGVSADVRLVGKIEPDETRLRYIAARVPGRIDRLFVDFTGIAVQADDPMAELYSPELIAAQEELLQAASAAQSAGDNVALRQSLTATLQATRDKLRLWGFTDRQISEIEREGRVRDHLTLHSPIGGVVIEKDAREGMYVETGQRIYTIADLSQLWVQLDAYETDLPWIAEGQAVTFTTQAHPGRQFEGTVSFISPVVDDRTRTVRVRVDLPNQHGVLKPGMFVRGVLQAPTEPAQELPLVIPASAPLVTGKRAVVYVQTADGQRPTFEGREVTLGPRAGDWYAVMEGVREGELVVTHGNFKLDSELQLRGRMSMMSPEGGAPPTHDHGAAAAPAPQAAQAQQPEAPQMQAPAEFSEQIGGVVRANFDLVKALAADDPHASGAAAQKTREALSKVDMSLVRGAAHDVWMAAQKQMDAALEQVAAAHDLKAQREHFERFSDELTKVVRLFGTGSEAPVYRAVCPMVQGRDGFWLQSWKDITNPYWGAAMYRCGEIAETLVEAKHEHGQ